MALREEAGAVPLAIERGLLGLVLALTVAAAVFLAIDPIAHALVRVPKDYNEGWNAYHAAHVFGPEPLYPAMDALISNNYPPLGFYVLAVVGGIVGDHVMAGRALAFAGLLASAALLARIAAHLGAERFEAAFAAAALVAIAIARHPSYVAMNDPQWFAHALMLAGLAVALGGQHSGGRRSTSRLAAAACLMLAAGLVKHNLVAVPIAWTAWLFLYDRDAAGRWLALATGLAAFALVGLWGLHGRELFVAVLASPRDSSLDLLIEKALRMLRPLAPLALPAVMLCLLAPRAPETRFVMLYAAVSALSGIGFLAGAGVDANALFDLVIALVLAGVLALAALRRVLASACRFRAAARVMTALVLIFTVFYVVPFRWRDPLGPVVALPDHVAIAAADIAAIGELDGAAWCEMIALCYWAGKPFAVDSFNLGQKLGAGVVDEARIAAGIEAGDWAVIQVQATSRAVHLERWSPAVDAALRAHYVVWRTSEQGGTLLRPRLAEPH